MCMFPVVFAARHKPHTRVSYTTQGYNYQCDKKDKEEAIRQPVSEYSRRAVSPQDRSRATRAGHLFTNLTTSITARYGMA